MWKELQQMKIIKYLRPSMAQDWLLNIRILSIEYYATKNINFDDIINNFVAIKARKLCCNHY
jgi:hypothetical protein